MIHPLKECKTFTNEWMGVGGGMRGKKRKQLVGEVENVTGC